MGGQQLTPGMLNSIMPIMQPLEVRAEMHLAKTHMGALIGRGGSTIGHIRQMSAATIKARRGGMGNGASVIIIIQVVPPHTYIHADIQTYTQTKHTYIHTYIHTYRHTYRHTYIQTYIHTYIHTYIYTYRQTYRHTYIQTDIQTDIHFYIHTYIHTDRHRDIHTYRQTYRHIWCVPLIFCHGKNVCTAVVYVFAEQSTANSSRMYSPLTRISLMRQRDYKSEKTRGKLGDITIKIK